MTTTQLRIALCYAPVDAGRVSDLVHERLRRDGFVVFDTSKVLAGPERVRRIAELLRRSDLAIVCLSKRSILKRGELHSHIRSVLAEQANFPEGEKYTIPVRLDEVTLPMGLAPFQAVDLFAADGYDRLKTSLHDSASKIEQRESERAFGAGIPGVEGRISLSRIPVPAAPSLFVGRAADISLLTDNWRSPTTDIVQIVADGGVGKSTLVWQWLEEHRLKRYQDIPQAIDWSFYIQSKHDYETDSHAFLEVAAAHFYPGGTDIPEESERSAEMMGTLIAHAFLREGGVVVLDGLEPLQEPPHAGGEGPLKDAGLRAFLDTVRNAPPQKPGAPYRLVIITTRWRVSYLKSVAVARMDLDNLMPEDGANLLSQFRLPNSRNKLNMGGFHPRRLRRELEKISSDFNGHPLALVLLASFVLRRYRGDLTKRDPQRFVDIAGQGDPYRHARRVMEDYDRLFADSSDPTDRACRQVLFLVGLFDRPVRKGMMDVVRAGAAIPALTDGLTEDLFYEAVDVLSGLRLLTHVSDPARASYDRLDTHPLIREHFGQTLQRQYLDSWRQAHLRLFEYLGERSVPLPKSKAEMDPLFEAVTHGCEAGLYRQTFLEIYRKRIMRGDEAFATRELVLFAPIVTCLSHFFERGDWSKPITAGEPGYALTEEDRLILLLDAGNELTAVKGYASSEVFEVYSGAVELAKKNGFELELIKAYYGLWRYRLVRGDFAATKDLAAKIEQHAMQLSSPVQQLIAVRVRCTTEYYTGEFGDALDHAYQGVDQYAGVSPVASDLVPELMIMCHTVGSLALWHLGCEDEALRRIAESLDRARALDRGHTLVIALLFDTWLQQFVGDVQKACERAQEMCKVCEEHGLSSMANLGMVMYAWALACLNDDDEKHLEDMAEALDAWLRSNARLIAPYCRFRMAECRIRRDDTTIAMDLLDEAIRDGVERNEKWWLPDCYRLRASLRAQLRYDPPLINHDLATCLELAMSLRSVALLRRGLETVDEWSVVLPADLLGRARAMLAG